MMQCRSMLTGRMRTAFVTCSIIMMMLLPGVSSRLVGLRSIRDTDISVHPFAQSGYRFISEKTNRLRILEDQMPDDDNWWYERLSEYANNDDKLYVFDDDAWHEKEVATRKNFWYMFTNPPSSWTASHWGYFAAFMTIFSVIFFCCLCSLLRTMCPLCC
uniref:Uncharacterized protein n=1 Tax=Trieres chinensis TaxID=1514140 RepID=A0A7S1ZPG1_TRICV|mmetsp:Transcript_29675/g.60605  ORF Transcript_29675/g.60605 Transcript_29675/m.60605 type:complete len:159 (+) Transcript_29675:52-528(+)